MLLSRHKHLFGEIRHWKQAISEVSQITHWLTACNHKRANLAWSTHLASPASCHVFFSTISGKGGRARCLDFYLCHISASPLLTYGKWHVVLTIADWFVKWVRLDLTAWCIFNNILQACDHKAAAYRSLRGLIVIFKGIPVLQRGASL